MMLGGRALGELGSFCCWRLVNPPSACSASGDKPPAMWSAHRIWSYVLPCPPFDFHLVIMSHVAFSLNENLGAVWIGKRLRRGRSLWVVRNPKVVEHRLEPILRGQAGIRKESPLVIPIREPPVVEDLHVVGDDERDHAAGEALFEHDEPAHAAVAVLEGVNALEGHVEAQDVGKRVLFAGIVLLQKGAYLPVDVFGLCCLAAVSATVKTTISTNEN